METTLDLCSAHLLRRVYSEFNDLELSAENIFALVPKNQVPFNSEPVEICHQ